MNRKRVLVLCCIFLCVLAVTVPAAAAPFSQSEETQSDEIELVLNEPGAEESTSENVEAETTDTETEEEEPEVLPDPPEAPVPEYPAGDLASTEIGFYWSPAQNADSYEVNLVSTDGFEETLGMEDDDWTCRMNRCILYTELPEAGDYTWTVTAINAGGRTESEAVNFSVPSFLPAPDAYRPNTALNNQRSLTFEWQDFGSAATSYRIQAVNTVTDSIVLDRRFSSAEMMHINGVCYLETDLFFAAGSYAWRVQASHDTTVSNWSSWQAFSVNCTECNLGTYLNTSIAAVFPVSLTTDLSPVFIWQTVTGALSYQLLITDGTGAELLNESILAETCTIEICSYAPEISFPVGESYSWTVTAHGWNNSNWGSASASFSTADLTEMNPISFVGPEDAAALDPDNQQVIWSDPGTQTAAFRLGIRDSSGEWLLIADLTREEAWCDGLTCSIQFHTIPEGEDYELFVIPYSEFNIPGSSISLHFSNIPE